MSNCEWVCDKCPHVVTKESLCGAPGLMMHYIPHPYYRGDHALCGPLRVRDIQDDFVDFCLQGGWK